MLEDGLRRLPCARDDVEYCNWAEELSVFALELGVREDAIPLVDGGRVDSNRGDPPLGRTGVLAPEVG